VPRPHSGSELTVEQLVRALAQASDLNFPSGRWAYLQRHVITPDPARCPENRSVGTTEGLIFEDPSKVPSLTALHFADFGIERDLSGLLLATRTVKNTSMYINGLPPEILSRVLEHRDCDRDLVAATHVCRYWRSTLISSPLLWTSLFSSDLDRTFTYLERSKSTPIDVKISLRSPKDLEVLKHIAPHIARTKYFVIDGTHLEVHAISPLFRNPVPSLQHLEIDSRKCSIRLPDDFLGQQASSLRLARLRGICPTSKLPFPLPNLTEFELFLPLSRGPLRMSALFQFFSGSPLLQKIDINTGSGVLEDIPPDQVISLESLMELDFASRPTGLILPYLRLPRLKRLCVYFSGEMTLPKLADLLPFDGRLLIAGTTKMLYYSTGHTYRVELSGKGIDVSLVVFTTGRTPVDWFSDGTYISFGRIEDLAFEGRYGSDIANFPINVFENLGILRVIPWEAQFAEGSLLLLSPGAVIPCRSLREIQYTYHAPLGPLINLARERKRAGYQLGLVLLLTVGQYDEDHAKELRKYVGEVRFEEQDPTR
jgi:hypothetical protein